MEARVSESLRAANLALVSETDLASVLSTLLVYVERLVPYDTANVMLLDPDGKLRVRALRGYERFTDPGALFRLALDGRDLVHIHAVLTTGHSYVIADTHVHPGWESFPETAYIRSWLGVPLIAGGAVIGIYSLDRSEPGFFTAQHRELTEAMAPQAAIAIRNARLHERMASHAATLDLEIAGRHRAEAALRGSEESFRLVADAAPHPILVVDPRGRIAYANAAAGHLLGYAPSAMPGLLVADLVPREENERHAEAWERLRSGQVSATGRTFELALRDRAGTAIPVEVSATVWPAPEGPVLTAILHDRRGP